MHVPPAPLRVLIVEDEPATAAPLARLVESWGFRPVVAFDGTAALRAAAEAPPDVILLDLGLPDMDGYEVAARLRAGPGARPVPVLALTGRAGAEDRRRSQEAGFEHHLVKPVEPEGLRRLLSTYQRPAEVHRHLCERIAGMHPRPGLMRRLRRLFWGR